MIDTPIELQITAITVDDYVDAFIARDRTARRARYSPRSLVRWVVVGVSAVFTLGALLVPERLWWVPFAFGSLTVWAIIVPRSMVVPRLLYRKASRRLVRDNPVLHGSKTLTFTADGLHTRTATMEAKVGWSIYQRYTETKQSFVLLVSDQPSALVQVLPKRALATPAETERLRALLDQHLQRVTP